MAKQPGFDDKNAGPGHVGHPHLHRKGNVPNTPLPAGWSWKVDATSKRPYFLNHIRKQTFWDDPRPLPYRWAIKEDPNKKRKYYLNHELKATQWEDPRPFPPAERGGMDMLGDDSSSSSMNESGVSSGKRKVDARSAAPHTHFNLKDQLSVLEGERVGWRTKLLAMGFEESMVERGVRLESLKSVDAVVDWVMNDPEDEPLQRAPSIPALDQMEGLRRLFIEDAKKGFALTNEQHNLINLPNHKPGDQYECKVCFDDELSIDQIFVLGTCKHFLCQDDLARHIVTLVKSMRASNVTCPMPDCKCTITPDEVRRCVSLEEHERYQEFLLQDALKSDPQCRWCPKPGCTTAMIAEPGVSMMRCPKLSCAFSFCFNCKEAWHIDMTCAQYQSWKKENGAGDTRYAEWARKNTKPCPKCHVAIQKNGGCNHMVCVNCRNEFCWLCTGTVLGPDGKYKSGHWALDEASPCHGKMHT